MGDEDKSLKRTVYFYEMVTKEFEMCNNSNVTYDNKYFLMKSFKAGESYLIKGTKTVDIIEFNDDCMFGSVGRLEDEKASLLKRQRDIKTLKKYPNDKINGDKKVEDFTYFYIGNKFNSLAVLRNSNAPKIKDTVIEYMMQNCQELEKSFIYPYSIKDIPGILKRFRNILTVDLAYSHNSNKKIIPSINELNSLAEDSIDKISLSVSMNKEIANKKFIEDIIDNDYSKFVNFKVSGLTYSDDLEETIDMVNKCFTKRISIYLSEDVLAIENDIKSKLRKELLANII